MRHSPDTPAGFSLASIGPRLSAWFEQWFPDAFALALAACAIVFAASLAIGAPAPEAAQWFGAGFWDPVAFTMPISVVHDGCRLPYFLLSQIRRRFFRKEPP